MMIMGFGLGLLLVMACLGGMFGAQGAKVPEMATPVIVPNHQGHRESLLLDSPLILKIDITGFIGSERLNTETVVKQLQDSQEGIFKGRIKGILLAVNSPGGTINAADGIFRAIKDYKEKFQVPVYAYVDGMCASGAYYISMAADQIYANPVSLVGSVGVVTPPFMNFSKVLDRIGIERINISAGKGKDMLNPFRPWKEGEEEPLLSIINYYYDQFVDHVAAHRIHLDRKELKEEYGAHVFPAPLAKEYAFIDKDNGSFNGTLKALADHAGLDANYQVISLQHRNWFAELLQGDSLESFAGKILSLPEEWSPKCNRQFLLLYQP
jgi:protease-4